MIKKHLNLIDKFYANCNIKIDLKSSSMDYSMELLGLLQRNQSRHFYIKRLQKFT